MVKMHIGLDDTDSPRKGCTTYVAALLIERLHKLGARFIDYPNLIRLNPNVPWKTRGNGALCLRIECDGAIVEEIEETVVETVEENSDLDYEGTEPGVVFFFGEVPGEVETFAKEAIQGIVEMKTALKLLRKFGAEAFGFKDGRGIVGGLAAVGELLRGDHTYEIITYRLPENRGTPRRIVASSVFEMNRETGNQTFNNIDPGTGRILITPRGPDPVLYGIRGEDPQTLRRAHEIVRSEEPIERWVIFRTNQGTDAHLRRVGSIKEIRPNNPVVVRGIVDEAPRIIPGGHVIFSIRDRSGRVDCAAYEPTGSLREAAKRLMVGDVVEVYGGVRPPSPRNPLTINLEKMRVLELTPHIILRNPLCPRCGKRMKSIGKDKGFECKRCGLHEPRMKKIRFKVERGLEPGLYVTSPRSQRHLTKPLSRYGLEKGPREFGVGEVVPYSYISST
jgi:tRNA(Ile2)-agmatinylcytidine synthase